MSLRLSPLSSFLTIFLGPELWEAFFWFKPRPLPGHAHPRRHSRGVTVHASTVPGSSDIFGVHLLGSIFGKRVSLTLIFVPPSRMIPRIYSHLSVRH